MSAVIDASALIGRSIRLSRRNVDTLLMAVLLPVMLMALFVYVFGGAVEPGGDYVRYVVPGIVLLCAGYGAASTAMPVADDINGGMIDRLRSLPIAPPPSSPGTSSPASPATPCRRPSSSAPRSPWASAPTPPPPSGCCWLAS